MKAKLVDFVVSYRHNAVVWTNQGAGSTADAGIGWIGFLSNAVKHLIDVGWLSFHTGGYLNQTLSKNSQLYRMNRTSRCASAAQSTTFLVPYDLPE
jgi:hypothetical protein